MLNLGTRCSSPRGSAAAHAQACGALASIQAAERANRDAFCSEHADYCHEIELIESGIRSATLGIALETGLLVVSIADLVPGDEVGVAAADAATIAARQEAIANLQEEMASVASKEDAVVIGSGESYLAFADKAQVNAFRIPPQIWQVLNESDPDAGDALNHAWVQTVIDARRVVLLSSDPDTAFPLGGFQKELNWFYDAGYTLDASRMALVPPP